MFTWILVAVVCATVVAVVVHEIRSWRKPGRRISLNAPMDDASTNSARYVNDTNIHNGGGPASR